MNDDIFQAAFDQALQAFEADEVPVGAVVFKTDSGAIIATTHNRTETDKNPLAHAELLAIRQACRTLGVKRLNGYSLFVTLEPCAMCAGAIAWARLDALFYGASDPKTGGVEQGARVFNHPQTHHKIHIEKGIYADDCGALLTHFFKQKRNSK